MNVLREASLVLVARVASRVGVGAWAIPEADIVEFDLGALGGDDE